MLFNFLKNKIMIDYTRLLIQNTRLIMLVAKMVVAWREIPLSRFKW